LISGYLISGSSIIDSSTYDNQINSITSGSNQRSYSAGISPYLISSTIIFSNSYKNNITSRSTNGKSFTGGLCAYAFSSSLISESNSNDNRIISNSSAGESFSSGNLMNKILISFFINIFKKGICGFSADIVATVNLTIKNCSSYDNEISAPAYTQSYTGGISSRMVKSTIEDCNSYRNQITSFSFGIGVPYS
jgi:hypothetical protein